MTETELIHQGWGVWTTESEDLSNIAVLPTFAEVYWLDDEVMRRMTGYEIRHPHTHAHHLTSRDL